MFYKSPAFAKSATLLTLPRRLKIELMDVTLKENDHAQTRLETCAGLWEKWPCWPDRSSKHLLLSQSQTLSPVSGLYLQERPPALSTV
jgi:hypothetical protein